MDVITHVPVTDATSAVFKCRFANLPQLSPCTLRGGVQTRMTYGRDGKMMRKEMGSKVAELLSQPPLFTL